MRFAIGAVFSFFFFSSAFHSALWAYESVPVPHGGTIRGSVHWAAKEIPEKAVHKVVKNTDFCGETFLDDALTVDPETRGMQNVAVYLENIERGRAPQGRYSDIVEKCRFKPRVVPAVKGATLGFRHNDFILHNIHAFLLSNGATLFNVGLPIHRWQQVVGQPIRRTGLFRLQCDIHTHMNGLIVSLEHDYVSVSDAKGNFEIREIPPGKYRLVALQAGYRIERWEDEEEGSRPVYEAPHQIIREVEVTAGGEARIDFEFGDENR
jgi:hypothetical protein